MSTRPLLDLRQTNLDLAVSYGSCQSYYDTFKCITKGV